MKTKQDALIDALNYISAENIFHIPSGDKKSQQKTVYLHEFLHATAMLLLSLQVTVI